MKHRQHTEHCNVTLLYPAVIPMHVPLSSNSGTVIISFVFQYLTCLENSETVYIGLSVIVRECMALTPKKKKRKLDRFGGKNKNGVVIVDTQLVEKSEKILDTMD